MKNVKSKAISEMKQNVKFIVIRHGETTLNKDGRLRGWIDVPLDIEGKKVVKTTGKEIRDQGLNGIYASDLIRTRQTAEIIEKETGIPILGIVYFLRPWDLGKFSGEKAKESLPILKNYMIDTPEKDIPEGESFNTFKNRFLDGVIGLRGSEGGKIIGLVTHHRNERLMAAWVAAGAKKNKEIDLSIMLCEGIKPGDWRWENERLD